MISSPPRLRSLRFVLPAAILTAGLVAYTVFWPKQAARQETQTKSAGGLKPTVGRALETSSSTASNQPAHVADSAFPGDKVWANDYRNLLANKDHAGLVALARRIEVSEESDFKSAREILLKAAALGSVEAARNLGRFAERGLIDDPDAASALRWYQSASDKGDLPSTVALGRLYLENKLMPVDLDKAESYLRLGVAAGNPEAMYLLAAGVLLDNPNGADPAIALLERAVGLGNTEASRLLARILATEQYGPVDLARAVELTRAAAKSGSNEAMVDLAKLLLTTNPSKASTDEAVAHLLAAGDQKNSRAQLEIARLFVSLPNLTAENAKIALDYALNAWNNGEGEAAMVLAAAYVAVGDMRSAQDMVIRYGTRVRDWRSLYAFSLYSTDKMELSAAIAKANTAEIGEHIAHSQAPLPPAMVFSASGNNAPRSSIAAVPVSTPAPHYPSGLSMIAKPSRITVEFDIAADGRTQDIRVLDDIHPQAVTAAVAAIAQWRYQPATLVGSGRAVRTRLRIPIDFLAD